MPIDGLDEDQVALHLSQSRIFLSFSYLEGCPLPPLEAAFAGNYVIGYTGQGGKEYWDPEIFIEIEHGNLLQFTRSIIAKIDELEKNIAHFPTENLMNLSKKHNTHQERADLEHFLRKIGFYVA
jgi:glycosyltransferase involved in cell wall biosynthesis